MYHHLLSYTNANHPQNTHHIMDRLDDTRPWFDASDHHGDLSYLLGPAAQSRHILAAHFVKDCEHVVEIGGFKSPITGFLTHIPKSVLVLDPLIREYHADQLHDSDCRVDHIAKPFQCYEMRKPRFSYGLVMLGISIKHFSNDEDRRKDQWTTLFDLVKSAKVTVFDYSLWWQPGVDTANRLLELSGIAILMQLDLDLSHDPGIDPRHAKRRFTVLQPQALRSLHPNRT